MIIALALLPADQIYTGFLVRRRKFNFLLKFHNNVKMLLNCRQFNVKMLPIYDWNLRKFRKLCSDFFSIGQVTGWLLKHQLVLASMDDGTGPIMTWSHGIVGLMHAGMDIDKTFGTLFVSIVTTIINYVFFYVYSLFYEFLVHFQECEESARLDFIALSQAQDIRREAVSVQAAERERLIIRWEQDLEDGLISQYEFLHQSMSCFEPAEVFEVFELGFS